MKLRLFTIGRTDITISPAAIVVAVCAVLIGKLELMLLGMLALTLHELAHALAAMAAGKGISEIELSPLGFCARLDSAVIDAGDALFIASAGPPFSLFPGLGSYSAFQSGIAGNDIVKDFAALNVAIASINMLPALPLDGGRMLCSALRQVVKAKTAVIIGSVIGILCGTAVSILGAYAAIKELASPMLCVLGIFMTVSAIKETKNGAGQSAKRLAANRERLSSGSSTGLNTLAFDSRVTVRQALKAGFGSRITMYAVIGRDMRTLGFINEAELMEAAARFGADKTLGELIENNIGLSSVIDRRRRRC